MKLKLIESAKRRMILMGVKKIRILSPTVTEIIEDRVGGKLKGRFLCNICAKNYLRKRHLQRHVRDECIAVPPRFDCDKCKCRFRRKYHIVRHLVGKHGVALHVARKTTDNRAATADPAGKKANIIPFKMAINNPGNNSNKSVTGIRKGNGIATGAVKKATKVTKKVGITLTNGKNGTRTGSRRQSTASVASSASAASAASGNSGHGIIIDLDEIDLDTVIPTAAGTIFGNLGIINGFPEFPGIADTPQDVSGIAQEVPDISDFPKMAGFADGCGDAGSTVTGAGNTDQTASVVFDYANNLPENLSLRKDVIYENCNTPPATVSTSPLNSLNGFGSSAGNDCKEFRKRGISPLPSAMPTFNLTHAIGSVSAAAAQHVNDPEAKRLLQAAAAAAVAEITKQQQDTQFAAVYRDAYMKAIQPSSLAPPPPPQQVEKKSRRGRKPSRAKNGGGKNANSAIATGISVENTFIKTEPPGTPDTPSTPTTPAILSGTVVAPGTQGAPDTPSSTTSPPPPINMLEDEKIHLNLQMLSNSLLKERLLHNMQIPYMDFNQP